MSTIEEKYAELSSSKKDEASKRARGRHVFLRLVDEGFWHGSTEPYVRVYHSEESGVFEWAHKDSLRMGRGGKQLKGKRGLMYTTVAGTHQAIDVNKVNNLAELSKLVANRHVKSETNQR